MEASDGTGKHLPSVDGSTALYALVHTLSVVSGDSSSSPFTASSERVLTVIAGGTISFVASQLVIPPLLPSIVSDFRITSAEAGVALTVMLAAAALSMYPGGRVSDQLSRPTALVAAVAAAAVGLAVASVAPSFLVFVVALAILGVGIGFFEPSSFATVSDVFVAARGRAFGIVAGSYNVGAAMAAGLAAAAAALGTWQFAFLPIIGLLLVVGSLFHHWRADAYVFEAVSLTPGAALRRVLVNRQLRLLLVLFSLYMFTWQASLSFFPTLLRTELDVAPSIATILFASIFAVGLTLTPIAGVLGDRLGHSRVGQLSPILGAAGLTVLLVVRTDWAVVAGTLIYALGLVSFWPVMTAELMNGLSTETVGADYGVTRAVFFGIGSLGPTYAGVVGTRASLTTAYIGLVVCFLLAAAVLLRINMIH